MTVLGLEPPGEWLVTTRLKRWMQEPPTSWHKLIALWFEPITDCP